DAGWPAPSATVAATDDADENGATSVLPVGTREELRQTLGRLSAPLGTDDDLATLEHLLTARARDLPGLRTPVRWYWIARRTEVSILLPGALDRKSTRLNSSHVKISYAVFCLKKKKTYCKSPKTSR